MPEVAQNPVRYSTGEIVLSHSDLASGGFGTPWGYRRSSYLAHGLGQAHTPWSIRS
jgi:hypothetical protein